MATALNTRGKMMETHQVCLCVPFVHTVCDSVCLGALPALIIHSASGRQNIHVQMKHSCFVQIVRQYIYVVTNHVFKTSIAEPLRCASVLNLRF